MKSFFVFDVESIGLHGEAFAVGGGLYLENGAAQWEFRLHVDPDKCEGIESDRKWVAENVPAFDSPTLRSAVLMRGEFWRQWMKAKESGAFMAAEVAWPVEANFLSRCIADDPTERAWQGPYPLIDISSLRFAAGFNPSESVPRTPSEMPAHDPLADARQSARLLSEALTELAFGPHTV